MNISTLKDTMKRIQKRWQTDMDYKYTVLCSALFVVHFMLFWLFYGLDVAPLYLYELGTVIFYLYLAAVYAKKKNYVRLLTLICIEVLLNSVLCSVLVGWDYGFMLYQLAMIPVVFYLLTTTTNLMHSFISAGSTSVVIVTCYVLTKWFGDFSVPVYQLDVSDTFVKLIYTLNCLIAFGMQILFSAFYTLEILHFKKNLEAEKDILGDIASSDPLTGLLNRRAMEPHLAEAKSSAEEHGKLFSLIICDIDDFKKVNDVYGHALGDQVLKDISTTFKANLRDSDFACRWGGEEFLMLVPGDIEIAAAVAERLRAEVEKLTFDSEHGVFTITMTFGVSEYITGYRIEKLIKIADDNLYIGKRNGKNQVVCP